MRASTLLLIATAALDLSAAGAVAAPPDDVDFVRDVAPIFEARCIRCHQTSIAKGDVSLANRDDLEKLGFVVPGEAEQSDLLEIVGGDESLPARMPKEGPPLAEQEIEVIRQWIAQGATWPDSVVLREKPQADRSWWSLQELADVEPPADGIPQAWTANPIDAFVFAELAKNGLAPSEQADRRTLIRRVTFDLTGLPPTPEEVEAFITDDAPDAYERLVDRLLTSPRYGEQWGRHWLDVVRFGESTGFEVNHIVDNVWQFRDYVIQSFNEDKPFDQFIIEHLAGDAVGGGDASVEVGLAFLVCGPTDIVGNADAAMAAQIRADAVDEIIRSTGEAFLGLTIGCARCHDHKFDPIAQEDYYRWYATFAGVFHGDRPVAPSEQLTDREQRLAALQAERQGLVDEQAAQAAKAGSGSGSATDAPPASAEPNARIADVDRRIGELPEYPSLRVGTFEQPAREQFVFLGGDANRHGATVVPASLSTLDDVAQEYQLSGEAGEQTRRLMLARWLTASDNPLTPRVLVNRLWHYHFGRGIVATPSDFGFMGERPTHPQLLDWLARQLQQNRWRLKPLHKLIVMSETYKQSSAFRAAASNVDADDRWLWRFPPRRLSAEELRDAMLLVAGQLDEQRGGPGFRLYDYTRDNVATYAPLDAAGPETFRRAVYHQNARASRVDLLTDFDAPDCAFSVGRRTATTTPMQALGMMNHGFTMAMAAELSSRVAHESGEEVAAQVDRTFLIALGRPATPEERAGAETLIREFGQRAFCRALLNSVEFLYVN